MAGEMGDPACTGDPLAGHRALCDNAPQFFHSEVSAGEDQDDFLAREAGFEL